MADIQCPHCGLWNTETTQRCDCGYDFLKGTVEASYVEANIQSKKSSANISRRTRVIGILNIVFSVIYLGCLGLGIASAPELVEKGQQLFQSNVVVVESVIGILVNGVSFLGLLFSGINLLQGRTLGRSLTFMTALLVIVFVVLDGCLGFWMIGELASRRVGVYTDSIIGGMFGVFLRAVYPCIAALVLLPSPNQLKLTQQ